MPRISQTRVADRVAQITAQLKSTHSTTCRQLAEHLGMREQVLYQWLRNNSDGPWMLTGKGRIQYRKIFDHLIPLIQEAEEDPKKVDAFLDWTITVADTWSVDARIEVSELLCFWFFKNPKGSRLNLLYQMVDRIKDRTSGKDCHDAWQSLLVDAISHVDMQTLDLMLAWIGDDWWAREFVEDEFGLRSRGKGSEN